jgi:hypothetical protein
MVCPAPGFRRHLLPVAVIPVHCSIEYIFYNVFLCTARSGQIRLEGLDGILVLESQVFLYMALKDYDGVRVLLTLAQGAFVRSFKPGEYTLGMKHMFA